MARPKTGKPPKKNLTLTVDDKTREQLDWLSRYKQQSISSMVAEWVDRDMCQLAQEISQQEKDKENEKVFKDEYVINCHQPSLSLEELKALLGKHAEEVME